MLQAVDDKTIQFKSPLCDVRRIKDQSPGRMIDFSSKDWHSYHIRLWKKTRRIALMFQNAVDLNHQTIKLAAACMLCMSNNTSSKVIVVNMDYI